ncbi:MAG: cobyric acid synthase [Rikenellaceae bacterium]
MKSCKLRPIMFVGTGSDVGKSVVNTGFCRVFLQDGYSPAPFKAQNMSLNSYATSDSLEIGRAQAVQAEACGIACTTDMNPILLKPTTHQSSQVVLNGRPAGNKSAFDYFKRDNRAELFVHAKVAFDNLSQQYNPIVLEGAGSISEVNLWDKDIVNMRMAEYADAATILIADIDRGGVFASVYGSIMLLPEEQRKLIKGVIINKFRGDIRLFEDGRKLLEELTGVPVVGVLPYLDDVEIEQEDSVVLERRTQREVHQDEIRVAVVMLRSTSNFTDFNMLERTKGVALNYATTVQEIAEADIVIIPGSKNTMSDMKYLRSTNLSQAILNHFESGKPLYGICGGYQIMGEMIYDPLHIEGDIDSLPGLGILPISTTIEEGKRTRQCHFKMLNSSVEGAGYEIHSGVTPTAKPLATLDDGTQDGYYLSDSCWGSYLHGIFDNKSVIEQILSQVTSNEIEVEDYAASKERNYNLLAEHIRKYIDMEYIYKIMRREDD